MIWVYTIFAYFHTITSLYLLYIFSWTITGAAEILYFRHGYTEAPMNDADAPVHMETVPSEEMQTKPIAPEAHFSESFTDVPYEFQADLEEVVSISLTLPSFTLDSESAASAINQTFVDLQINLQNYMGTTVYETAQARHTIGFLEGNYTASLENGILSVTYTVTERYADDDGKITHENVYRFDTSNGERLDA